MSSLNSDVILTVNSMVTATLSWRTLFWAAIGQDRDLTPDSLNINVIRKDFNQ